MACLTDCSDITEFGPGCESAPGGNKSKIWATPRCNIAAGAITTYPTDLVTAITLTTGNWIPIIVETNSILTSETINPDARSITQNLTYRISNLSNDTDLETAAQDANAVAEALLAEREGWAFIVEDKVDNDGVGIRRLFGKSAGLVVSAGDKTSGTVGTDIPGNTLTFTETQSKYAPVVSSAIVLP